MTSSVNAPGMRPTAERRASIPAVTTRLDLATTSPLRAPRRLEAGGRHIDRRASSTFGVGPTHVALARIEVGA